MINGGVNARYSGYPSGNDFWNSLRSAGDLKPHLFTFRDNDNAEVDILIDGGHKMSTGSTGSKKDLKDISIDARNNSDVSRYLNSNISEIVMYNNTLKIPISIII